MAYDSPDESPAEDRQCRFALVELIAITRDTADILRETARELHDDLELSVSARGVMLELRKQGPMTVPALARHSEVSRQFIQATVNPLLANGLLESQPNPAHKRSRIIALTENGAELITRVMRREGGLMNDLVLEFQRSDLETAEIRRSVEALEHLQKHLKQRL